MTWFVVLFPFWVTMDTETLPDGSGIVLLVVAIVGFAGVIAAIIEATRK